MLVISDYIVTAVYVPHHEEGGVGRGLKDE